MSCPRIATPIKADPERDTILPKGRTSRTSEEKRDVGSNVIRVVSTFLDRQHDRQTPNPRRARKNTHRGDTVYLEESNCMIDGCTLPYLVLASDVPDEVRLLWLGPVVE